jgi:ComF family protein
MMGMSVVMDDELAEKPKRFQFQTVGAFFRGLIDVITPPKCLACSKNVQVGASLCTGCWSKLTHLEEPVCDMLGTPFAYDQGEGALSAAAIAAPPPWDRARAAVLFDDAAKGLVHALKYRDNGEAGLLMIRMMARAGRDLLKDSDVVIPVPLHRSRLWKRRFNQAAYLAKPLAKLADKPYATDILLRNISTRQQVGLNYEARQRNVKKAFTVPFEKQALIGGKSIMLVDDVRTTGATAAACALALKKAGAARVFVMSFALVLEPLRLHIEA